MNNTTRFHNAFQMIWNHKPKYRSYIMEHQIDWVTMVQLEDHSILFAEEHNKLTEAERLAWIEALEKDLQGEAL